MLLFAVLATTVAACGGFLGFGDDEDEPRPVATVDSGADVAITVDDDAGPSLDASGEIGVDAIAVVDAGADVVDQTPIDAGTEVLVWAPFENALVGQDGADGEQNMERSKAAAIHDQFGARTLATHPAFVAFTFPAQSKVYVSFSVRVEVVPAKPGAELLRLTGGGTPLAVFVTSDAVFGLRNGQTFETGSKLTTGSVYRVGVEVDVAAGRARAGVAEIVGGSKPTLTAPLEVVWTGAAPVGTMLLGAITNDPGFALAVDDVLVSTKGFVGP